MKYLSEEAAYKEYDEYLDEGGTVMAGGLPFSPSRILKELDEVAYDEGFANWCDAEGVSTEDEPEEEEDEEDEEEDES